MTPPLWQKVKRPIRFLSPWNFPGKNWSGLPFPSPWDLPDPGIELGSPALQADSLLSEPPGKPNRKLKLARGKKTKNKPPKSGA